MSDIFKQAAQKPKRTFGDWLFDNFGWVMLGSLIVSIFAIVVLTAYLSSHAHEIARDVGGIARSAADGFNQPAR